MNFGSLLASNITFPSGGWFLENVILWLLQGMYNFVGEYGVAIILFTIILRVIMLPMDFGNKYFTKKNAFKMAELKPEIDKINKIYGNDMLARNRATQALYKRKGHSQGGFCLFMFLNLGLTLLVFITVFGVLNQMSAHNINNQYRELQMVHERFDVGGVHESLGLESQEFRDEINQVFEDTRVSFLWVQSMWRPDNWSSPTLSFSEFRSSVSGISSNALGIEVDNARLDRFLTNAVDPANPTQAELNSARSAFLSAQYSEIFTPINAEHGGWNGLLILVILAAITTYFSVVINMKSLQKKADEKKTEEPVLKYSMRETLEDPSSGGAPAMPAMNPAQMGKIMKFALPAVMVVVALIYNAAFALYITVGSIVMTGFTFLTNYLAEKLLKRQGLTKEEGGNTPVINPHAKYFKKDKR